MIPGFIVTLNFGRDQLATMSRQSMQHAARRWGATFREIARSPFPGFAAKLRLDLLAPSPGRIVYLDRDTVLRDDCPSLLDLVPPGHFGYVAADQGALPLQTRETWHIPVFNRWMQTLGGRCAYHKDLYFNSGVMVFDLPAHAPVFARARRAVGEANYNVTWYDEQGCLSASANLGDIPVQRLPATFNFLETQHALSFSPEPMNAMIYHFNGCRGEEKLSKASRAVWNTRGHEAKGKSMRWRR